MPVMRAKMKIQNIIKHSATLEKLVFAAVSRSEGYPPDGLDENNTFAKFSPSGSIELTVANPALIGIFEVGESFYIDFTPVPAPAAAVAA